MDEPGPRWTTLTRLTPLLFAVLLFMPWPPPEPPIQKPLPSPTPFWNATIIHEWDLAVAKKCLVYLPLYYRWLPDFPELEWDVVLAVAAEESHCDANADGIELDDGRQAVGLMQVMPWILGSPSPERLAYPAVNMYWGMRTLHWAIINAENEGVEDPLLVGLAFYNCGERAVLNQLADGVTRCGSTGGPVYAERVLRYWVPLIREASVQATRLLDN